MKDTTPKELKEFVEGLPQEKFDRLKLFVDNLPNFVVTAEAISSKRDTPDQKRSHPYP